MCFCNQFIYFLKLQSVCSLCFSSPRSCQRIKQVALAAMPIVYILCKSTVCQAFIRHAKRSPKMLRLVRVIRSANVAPPPRPNTTTRSAIYSMTETISAELSMAGPTKQRKRVRMPFVLAHLPSPSMYTSSPMRNETDANYGYCPFARTRDCAILYVRV